MMNHTLLDAVGHLVAALGLPVRCLVKGCSNHSDQGVFVGPLCMPCHHMLTTGEVGHGATFVHELATRPQEAEPCPFMGSGIIHPECISPVPEGYDTVLGFLAKYHADALECFDYTDPATTQRDGWWLSHRSRNCVPWYVPAPPVLREQGIERVRAYPVELLHKRWG
jgi:hypothetical protein